MEKIHKKFHSESFAIDLIIPDGMNMEFGDKYLIKSIPKYILIDKEGIILDSNLPEPSTRMEQMILKEIEKTSSKDRVPTNP